MVTGSESFRAQGCQGQEMEHMPFAKAIFFFFSHQISAHAGKRAIDRSRCKFSGEEIATASDVL